VNWTKQPKAQGNDYIICPYCHLSGFVTTAKGKVKDGLSGGKILAAILTLGFTLLLTGLSRKQDATKLHCGHCGMEWSAR
jgi:DNA-directed RNA polymerase subunit RPC12/RpoP